MADLPPPTSGAPDIPAVSRVRLRRPALRARARAGGLTARENRTGRALSVAIALHLAAGAIVLQLLTFGHGLYGFLDRIAEPEPVVERLTYVEPQRARPSVAAVRPVPSASRIDPATITGPVVGAVVAAPLSRSAADTGSGVAAGTGVGGGVGAVDPSLRGAVPAYGDGRAWAGTGKIGAAPARSGAEKLDSIIATVLTLAADSLDSIARANGAYGKAPGDWTKTDKNGEKWGWDNKGIRLGKVVIPNALLSLLPMNAQAAMSGNASSIDRERRLGLARADINRFSTMTLGDAEFKKINTELRQRRERERRDRLRAPSAVSVDAVKPVDK